MEGSPIDDQTTSNKVEEIDETTPDQTGADTDETKVDSEAQPAMSPEEAEEKKKMISDLLQRMQAQTLGKDPKNSAAYQELQKYKPLYEKHEFWDTQPVPKQEFGSEDLKEGEIEKGKLEEVKQEPYGLPAGFEWCDIDLDNEEQLEEVYCLLRDHYVEDSDHMFRFDYQKEFLKWALQPPKQYSDWVCGVRGGKNNKLFGFITGIPVKLRIRGKQIKMTEINFLCVHKKIRKLRLAPVLIKEITRRTHIKNMWQAIYTAGIVIPRPIAECTYYHRNLNTKKLLEVGFSSVPTGRSKSLHIKLLSMPKEPTIANIRPMQKKDCKKVQALLEEYLQNFELSFHFNKEEIQHFFLPRDKVMFSYVVTDPETDEITDFISYYSLPSTIIDNKKYKTLYAAFCYYVVPKKHSMSDLMKNALILARNDKFDVFNCLDILDNKETFDDLHFGVGNGNLYYYLYNWSLKKVPSSKIGIVLV